MQDKIKRKVKRMLEGRDPAHDFYHIMRVYKNAKPDKMMRILILIL
jgi:hypothetical protein